jgi:hypothetical protein
LAIAGNHETESGNQVEDFFHEFLKHETREVARWNTGLKSLRPVHPPTVAERMLHLTDLTTGDFLMNAK